uniref:Uncharacterized protein n=1 Tax=Timema shepardi TaxID=629360 RepID=A0A7R9FXW2_TIMSH|nr:unnamed protein product [Timema shepardi]
MASSRYSSPMASLVLTDSLQLTSDRQHLGTCYTVASNSPTEGNRLFVSFRQSRSGACLVAGWWVGEDKSVVLVQLPVSRTGSTTGCLLTEASEGGSQFGWLVHSDTSILFGIARLDDGQELGVCKCGGGGKKGVGRKA